jgi:hypothetical protein
MGKKQVLKKRWAGHRQTGVSDPALRDLLDHLGRVLAQEYVALLTKTKTPGKANSEGTES